MLVIVLGRCVSLWRQVTHASSLEKVIIETWKTGDQFLFWMSIKKFALCLSKVLEFIIDPDQTCSVPGCRITSNLHILRDVLDYVDRTNETSISISLDEEKAFDRVNRTFLLNLLSRFGSGPSFCFWINTLYNGANMRIIVNEWFSDAIPLSRCILSHTFFHKIEAKKSRVRLIHGYICVLEFSKT